MSEDLRRKSDVTMAEMQRDIKDLKKSAKTTQASVVALATTIDSYTEANTSSHESFDRAIFGEKNKNGEIISEGIFQKVNRHEKLYKIWEFILYDWKGLTLFAGFIGYPLFRDIVKEVITVFFN